MDSRIALGIRPVQIPSRAEGLGKALTLRALMGQDEAQQFQLGQARSKAEEEEAMKAALRSSGGDFSVAAQALLKAGFHAPAAALQKAANETAKSGLDIQGSQAELAQKQNEIMATLAASVANAPPNERAGIYPAMAAEWRRLGLPNSDKVPDQWDEAMLPHLQTIARRGQTVEQSTEAANYRALAGNQGVPMPAGATATGAAPTPAYAALSGTVPHFTGPKAVKMRYSDSAEALMNPQGAPPAAGQPSEQWDEVKVTGRTPAISAAEYRAEARRLDAQGTKQASERAKEYRAEAARMDEAEFKRRDKLKPQANAPGILFDEEQGIYLRDGKPVTAEEVQKIADRNRKAGASTVNVGMNAGDAAKTELLNQGISDMAEFKAILMPDGNIDRGIVVGMNVPGTAGIPGTDSRIAYSLIYNAVEAKLRAESGAAVPEQEVQRMAARFIPSPLDSDDTIKSKVRRMEAFLRGSFGRVKGAGEPSVKSGAAVEAPARRVTDNAPATNAKGWKLHTDAQGRKAYVSPDGKQFEEVR